MKIPATPGAGIRLSRMPENILQKLNWWLCVPGTWLRVWTSAMISIHLHVDARITHLGSAKFTRVRQARGLRQGISASAMLCGVRPSRVAE